MRGRPSSEPATSERPVSPRSTLWRHPDFLRLWLGQSVSLTGTFAGQLAFPLVALTVLHASSFEVGLISASQFLPVLFVTLLAGYWIDLTRRRPILITANVMRIVVLLAAVTLLLTDSLSVWSWALIAFTIGTFTAVFDVAWHSYMPSLLTRDQLVEGNAKMQTTYAISQIAGTGMGGWLTKVLTPVSAFTFNIVTYVVATIAFLRIRTVESPPKGIDMDESIGHRITLGFKFLWHDLPLRALMLSGAWFNLCEQALLTLFMIYGVRTLGLDAAQLGLCIGLGSVGAFLGAVVARRVADSIGLTRTLTRTMGLTAVAPVLLPLFDRVSVVAIICIVIAFNAYGLGQTVFNVYNVSLRQQRTPNEVIGRVTAAFRTVAFGALPIGALTGGALGEWLGPRSAMFVVVVAFIAGWLAFLTVAPRWIKPFVDSQAG